MEYGWGWWRVVEEVWGVGAGLQRSVRGQSGAEQVQYCAVPEREERDEDDVGAKASHAKSIASGNVSTCCISFHHMVAGDAPPHRTSSTRGAGVSEL